MDSDKGILIYETSNTKLSMDINQKLKELIINEARSCSMDFGCVTPLYVYRMWGGTVAIEDIKNALKRIKNGYR